MLIKMKPRIYAAPAVKGLKSFYILSPFSCLLVTAASPAHRSALCNTDVSGMVLPKQIHCTVLMSKTRCSHMRIKNTKNIHVYVI